MNIQYVKYIVELTIKIFSPKKIIVINFTIYIKNKKSDFYQKPLFYNTYFYLLGKLYFLHMFHNSDII